jgi:hypothetical protein
MPKMPNIKETLRSICFYKIDPPEADLRRISILEIIFLHYVARSFCETFKLPKELPKIAKCLIRRRRTIDYFLLRKKTNFVIISTC